MCTAPSNPPAHTTKRKGKSQTATPQLEDQPIDSLITTASLKSINLLISGEDVLALDQWAQLPPTHSQHHHWPMIQSLWDTSGGWGTDICEWRNFQLVVIIGLYPASASNLSSKGSRDRITRVPLISIFRTPSKATLGVKEAMILDPSWPLLLPSGLKGYSSGEGSPCHPCPKS